LRDSSRQKTALQTALFTASPPAKSTAATEGVNEQVGKKKTSELARENGGLEHAFGPDEFAEKFSCMHALRGVIGTSVGPSYDP
jgi:hypothetical protein